MENLESDAFVFFGATGDLAYEQIFPALQAMNRRGHFDMPIIGVARSAKDLDGLRARARESIEKHGGLDPAHLQRFRQNSSMSTETTAHRKHSTSCERHLALHLDLFITLLYLQTCLRLWLKVWPMQNATKERGWWSKSHLAATFPRRRRSIERSINLFPNRRFSGLTITLARSRSKIFYTSASPIHSWSRFGTGTISKVSRSRWLKTLACEGGESFMKSWVRSGMSFKTTC
jgi:Glucose-6-phosphate dehydrogenase, NAD binding domain